MKLLIPLLNHIVRYFMVVERDLSLFEAIAETEGCERYVTYLPRPRRIGVCLSIKAISILRRCWAVLGC